MTVSRWMVSLSLICCLLGAVAQATAAPIAGRALVVLTCEDPASMREVILRIEAAGGLVRHSFPPHVAIAELPEEAESALLGWPEIYLVARSFVDPAAIPADFGDTARYAVIAWNRTFVSPAPRPAFPPPGARPLVGDVRFAQWEAPPFRLAPAAPAPPGANQYQTSEYLMGTTTISLVFLESNGAIDPNLEDWTVGERAEVVSECLAGMDWWASTYPYPVAPLSFTWDYQYGVPTGYEPITQPSTSDYLWLIDALNYLGYPCDASTYLLALFDQANDLRDAYNTDWAFVVFLVDSSADLDGKFPDGYFGYAFWINGPTVVMTYDNDGWGISQMDTVLAHEAGHVYGALDEYSVPEYAECDPSAYSGYLNIQNTNCNSGIDCLMNNNYPAVCPVSSQQIGWRDPDVDAVPDILDVPPIASLDPYDPDPTDDTTPTYTGSASVGFYPNLNPRWGGGWPDVTVNRIANVQYRIDGGSWQDCTAADGAFDQGTEAYTFTTSQLAGGTYTFEARAIDTSGNATGPPYPSDALTISAAPLPELLLELHPNERGQGPPTTSLRTGGPFWTWPTPSGSGGYTWKTYKFGGSASLWVQVCAQAYAAFQNKPNNGFGSQDTLLMVVDGVVTPIDVWGIQSGPLGSYQWKGDSDQGRRVELEFLVTGLAPGQHTLRLTGSMCPSIYWVKVYDLEPRYAEEGL